MIQAHELRIGNYVDIDGIITTVNHVMGDEDYFDGVALTEEIFFKVAEASRLGYQLYEINGLWICSGNFGWRVSYNGVDFPNEIFYLHHLQNLHHCFFSKELTITL